MLNISSLKKLLGEHANNYGEAELEKIRHDAYEFANLAFEVYKQDPKVLDNY